MEKFLNSLPKPALALLAIAVAVIFFMFNDPPHTVCDVQKENLKESLRGELFPDKVKKGTIPPLLASAQEACQMGNSPGSCFEYFSILKKITKDIQNYSSECKADLIKIAEVNKALREGVILMAKIAWGSKPPEPGPARFGWMQDAELSLFCQIKNVYSLALGDEAWTDLRNKVYSELPGEPPTGAASVGAEAPKANATLMEKDLWQRSIFSLRCENY